MKRLKSSNDVVLIAGHWNALPARALTCLLAPIGEGEYDTRFIVVAQLLGLRH